MIIDLHVHTTISGDSIITPETLVHAAKNNGLEGLCITEHGIEKSRLAEELAAKYDFPVFGGIEASTELGDILVFGIDKYPRIISKASELKDFVEDAGGVLIASHPFRSYFYHSNYNPRLTVETGCQSRLLQLVNDMEMYNGWSTEEEVVFCQGVSKKLGLKGTGGSDAHIPLQIGCCVTVFENTIRTEGDLVVELRQGRVSAEDRRLPQQKGPMNWFR
ncbi:MAG: PHP-associated domain-containing protein [Pseudomonadota bacterium]